MTTAERDEKLANLQAQYDVTGEEIRRRTEAARTLNEENRLLMARRSDLRTAIETLKKVQTEDGADD